MATERDRSHLASCFIMTLFVVGFLLGLPSIVICAGHGVKLDGTLGQTPGTVAGGKVNGASTTYLIKDTLGRKAGANLFYSFDRFNIYTGESATFHSPGGASYDNIISRVTGGTPSTMDGLLRSTIDGANLFLMNPSGVMFGPNASLDVKGSFHVSTADYLRFTNGDVFYADPGRTSVLSVASPEAFGFLNSRPAAISLDRSALKVPDGQTLSIVGGEVAAVNDPAAATYFDYENFLPGPTYYTLSAPAGRINLFSFASQGEASLTPRGNGCFGKPGNITLANGANLNVSSSDGLTPAGSVAVRSGKLVFNGSNIDANGSPGGAIDIKADSFKLDTSTLYALGFGDADHPGAACLMNITHDFTMKNESLIDSSNYGPGRGGDIKITAGNINLGDDRPGTGPFREIGMYGFIQSQSYSSGRGGDISLNTTGNLEVKNGFYVNTAALDQGPSGNIDVRARTINLLDRGNISSNGLGLGDGGIVELSAHDILISGTNEAAVLNSFHITGIAAQAQGVFSNGGRIRLNADSLRISNGGQINTILFGSGRGADIDISAGHIFISGFVPDATLTPPYKLSGIDARVAGSEATGRGGNINVTADSLKITDGGVIRTNLFYDAPGTAGNIMIRADGIKIAHGGQIYADSFRGTGNSGDITINANSMTIAGFGSSSSPYPVPDFTGLSTTTNAGRGGTINVALAGDLSLRSRGGISAETRGSGPGGAINIEAGNALLSGGSAISAATSGAGKAGNISIIARSLMKMDNSLVTTAADFAQGGNINVLARDIRLGNGAVISAESSGAGNAGDIGITAANAFESRNSAVTTEARAADGGNVLANVGYMVRLIDSKITTSVGGGSQTVGGNINVASNYVILQNSRIIASAYEGRGGNIGIDAGTFLADPNSLVDASSALGIDGSVDIRAVVQSIAGIVQPLPKDFVSAGDLLRSPCEARLKGDKAGSLVVKGRDGLPVEPGGFLPSPM